MRQGGPLALKQVDAEALDVRPVQILVRHEQHLAVSQPLGHVFRRVVAPVLQSQDALDFRDFRVFRNALDRLAAHVHELALDGIHADRVAVLLAQARHNARLGRIPLAKDDGALRRLLRPREIGVNEFRNAANGARLCAVRLLRRLRLLHFRQSTGRIHHAHLRDFFHELVAHGAGRPEVRARRCQFVLRLAGKRGVLHVAAQEQRELLLDRRRLHVHLLLGLDVSRQFAQQLAHDVLHVLAALGRANAVHE